jgi:hypothetical protein
MTDTTTTTAADPKDAARAAAADAAKAKRAASDKEKELAKQKADAVKAQTKLNDARDRMLVKVWESTTDPLIDVVIAVNAEHTPKGAAALTENGAYHLLRTKGATSATDRRKSATAKRNGDIIALATDGTPPADIAAKYDLKESVDKQAKLDAKAARKAAREAAAATA